MNHRTESMRIVTRVAQRCYPLAFLLALATTACGEDAIDPIECAAPVDGQCAEGCAQVSMVLQQLEAERCSQLPYALACMDERFLGPFVEDTAFYLHPDRPGERVAHFGHFLEDWYKEQGRDLGYCIGDDVDGLIEARPEDFCTELNADFERRCEELGRI